MDPITRQVGQHIEMEPEWEAAFTLQMKLTHVISMVQDWCALDVSSSGGRNCEKQWVDRRLSENKRFGEIFVQLNSETAHFHFHLSIK